MDADCSSKIVGVNLRARDFLRGRHRFQAKGFSNLQEFSLHLILCRWVGCFLRFHPPNRRGMRC